jgi:hypothetical protein
MFTGKRILAVLGITAVYLGVAFAVGRIYLVTINGPPPRPDYPVLSLCMALMDLPFGALGDPVGMFLFNHGLSDYEKEIRYGLILANGFFWGCALVGFSVWRKTRKRVKELESS